MNSLVKRPAPLLTDGSNTFAYHSMRKRIPNIISEVIRANPSFAAPIRDELELLKQDIERNAPIIMLNLFPTPPPDYVDWANAYISHQPDHSQHVTWLNTGWFFAETFIYRLIIEAVRWWETGKDPFLPMKQEALNSWQMWDVVGSALAVQGGAIDRLPELVKYTVWGNRIDLSYAAAADRGTTANDDDLIIDDSERFAQHMLRAQLASFPESDQGVAHIIVDNTGTELAMDLVLADTLISGFSDIVVLHVKYHPTFISDATATDVRDMIARFISGSHGNGTIDDVVKLGKRLEESLHIGRLRVAPNLFWNSSHFLWEMPGGLSRVFDDAQVVILKGDANYRRAVGDAIWEPTTTFEEVTQYFPAPLLAVRTLKSDPVVGLREGQTDLLNDKSSTWQVDGQYGLIQLNSYEDDEMLDNA